MDDRPFIHLPRLLGLLAIAFLLASCTKFHTPDTAPPETPSTPETFTPEEIGEVLAANLIEDVEVELSADGIRFTWIEDDLDESADYWILVSTDGEGFEPIHTFTTDDVAHMSTLSTATTLVLTPDVNPEAIQLYQALMNAGYERDGIPVADPITGQIHAIEALFDSFDLDPRDLIPLIEAANEDPSNIPALLDDLWPDHTGYMPPSEADDVEQVEPPGYSITLLARLHRERAAQEQQEAQAERIEALHEQLLNARDELQERIEHQTEQLEERRSAVLERMPEKTFTLHRFMDGTTTNFLSGKLASIAIDESLRVGAKTLKHVQNPVMYTPTLLGSPLFYSPSSAGQRLSLFHLSSNVPGYAVVTKRDDPNSDAAFVVCVQDPELTAPDFEDNQLVPSCHGAPDGRKLLLEDPGNGTDGVTLAFIHEHFPYGDLDQQLTMRISTVLPSETAQFTLEDAEDSDASVSSQSVLEIEQEMGGFRQAFLVTPGEHAHDSRIIIAIEIFIDDVIKPVFWNVYELNLNNLPTQ